GCCKRKRDRDAVRCRRRRLSFIIQRVCNSQRTSTTFPMRHFKVEAFFVRIAALFVLCLPGAALMGEAYRDVPPAMRTVWGVTLNRDNASTLLAQLGPAPSWKSGAGHDGEVNWCFRAGRGPKAATLRIPSHDG